MWLTWANGLTALRAAMALPCVAFVLAGHWTAAALLLSLAILTDLLDGPLARRLDQSSPLGGLIDHATDAAFVTLLLLALWRAGYTPVVLPVLVAASFLQYTLDSRALQGRALRGSALGRANGIAYFVVAGVPVYRNALDWSWPADAAISAAGWLLVASSLLSMIDRLRRRRAAADDRAE